ncbi:hypothetical protein PCANC_24471 [Puccinia coronata f. sp. avenae]|uniref:RPA43 OB domain-containing protein n=1 Tax=Puccinia coronata f. sp. avenae TaxID=200324 RepID=A0A2N5TP43_9BASI|nr:hypothetical protein PCANC_24471 [Puccinia coronata f. sp. avenae]
MARSKSAASSSNQKPNDFHHLVARFKIPLAPSFLSKPTRPELKVKLEEEMDDLKSTTSSGSEKKMDTHELVEEYGNSGPLEAVNQSLASLLMKYIPSLGAVLVSYLEPPTFILSDEHGNQIRRTATKSTRLPVLTLPGNAWGVVDVEVKLMGWRPTIGQKLIGRPTLSSPSHLSLVIYRTFNASINEHHLKAAGYHYDLNFEVPDHWKSIGETTHPQDTAVHLVPENKDRGCWVDANGVVVGGQEGTISFTVMGLTIANHMISVMGSLLDDPFSIERPARPSQPSQPRAMAKRKAIEREDSEGSSEEDSDSDGHRSKAHGSTRDPPTVLSAAAVPRPAIPSHPAPPPIFSHNIPPPLTVTNLKALNSAHVPPSNNMTFQINPPLEKSDKKPSKKKSRKRPAESVVEEKPSPSTFIPPLPSASHPIKSSHSRPSSINSSRKKKIKTSSA